MNNTWDTSISSLLQSFGQRRKKKNTPRNELLWISMMLNVDFFRRYYFHPEKCKYCANHKVTAFWIKLQHLLGCRKSGRKKSDTLHLQTAYNQPESCFQPSSWAVQIDSHDAKCVDLGEHSHRMVSTYNFKNVDEKNNMTMIYLTQKPMWSKELLF